MPTLLSLDPGGTTGASVIFYNDQTLELIEVKQVKDGLKGFLNWSENTNFNYFDEIICESFTLRPGVHGADITPAYIIGALEALLPGGPEVTYQAPSQKKLCGDDRLKNMNLHTPGMQHANDATRHGIIYLRNRMHLPTLKKGWPE